MQQAVVIVLAFLVAPAAGASLRRSAGDPPKPADTKAKWEKMDDFLGTMFTMACKWKHGKDVAGAAAEKLKNGDVKGADGYAAEVKDIQAGNVKGLQKACGLIVSEHLKACREGCATRNSGIGFTKIAGQYSDGTAERRNECDKKCVSTYNTFEMRCASQADNLKRVYDQVSSKAGAQKQCYEGHCKAFPMVWMKSDDKAMKDEVKKQCEKRCTDKNVKAGCQQKWAAEIDFVSAKVNSDCAEASGVSECIDGKKGDVSGKYKSCQSDSKKDCESAHKKCTTDGNADKNFKDAKGFCDDRKTMCLEQANEKCQKENKANLAEAEGECKAKASKELTKCQDDTLAKLEKDSEKKCIAKRGPTCKKDCNASCEVGKMKTCLAALKTKDDPGKMFCKDLWGLLHGTAEVDPVTGDPISLLSPKAAKLGQWSEA